MASKNATRPGPYLKYFLTVYSGFICVSHATLLLSIMPTGWSVEEVNQQFLERAGLGYMAEQFYANKINGKCLMLLTEVSY